MTLEQHQRIKYVILDFGHGGIGSDGKYTTSPAKMYKFSDGTIAYEGVLNRQIGGHVQACLRSHPELEVITTVKVDDPRDLALSYRVRVANSYSKENAIFVSIHCNASPSHNASGFEIYTTKGTTKSDELAECIADSSENALNKVKLKTRYDFSDGDKDKESDFYVLRKTSCPAVLIECGFFDYRPDFNLLSNTLFQGDLGSFIYTGIMNYIEQHNEKINL